MEKIQKKIHYPGWELKYFDRSKNFRNYQLSLFKKYLRGEIAEVGPGNGGNLSGYLNFPKKLIYMNHQKIFFPN